MNKYRSYLSILVVLCALQISAAVQAQDPICFGFYNVEDYPDARPGYTEVLACIAEDGSVAGSLALMQIPGENVVVTFRALETQVCGNGSWCRSRMGQARTDELSAGEPPRSWAQATPIIALLECFCD
jgi:hypothetical protein